MSSHKSIKHIEKLTPCELFELRQSLEFGNYVATEKIDGFNLTIGKLFNGLFFMQTARSSVILNSGSFLEYTSKKTDNPIRLERASQYDKLFDELRSSKFVKSLPLGSLVQAECLYVPMAKDLDDFYQFVKIEYPKNQIKSKITLFPLKVLNWDPYDYSDDLITVKSNKVDISEKINNIIRLEKQEIFNGYHGILGTIPEGLVIEYWPDSRQTTRKLVKIISDEFSKKHIEQKTKL